MHNSYNSVVTAASVSCDEVHLTRDQPVEVHICCSVPTDILGENTKGMVEADGQTKLNRAGGWPNACSAPVLLRTFETEDGQIWDARTMGYNRRTAEMHPER
ncbi:hypothetical protein D8B26_001095 [Coccidioides posadasii str. Silveira]|uniref:uncharacterized protein n=1 Tax=Coccidioides posadasii (strain RMSCC 757 / Silveira) TaxID=443226 RepID=UPI001BEFB5DF|nr:hypothetical protein D8B26_001095 [Coccidioides posadasii str. Silveira]